MANWLAGCCLGITINMQLPIAAVELQGKFFSQLILLQVPQICYAGQFLTLLNVLCSLF